MIRESKVTYWIVRRLFLKYRAWLYWAFRRLTMDVLRKTKDLYWFTRRQFLKALRFSERAGKRILRLIRKGPERIYNFLTLPAWRTNTKTALAKKGFVIRRDRYKRFARHALALARKKKPDLVYAHDLSAILGAVKAQEKLGIPYVYDSHELWTDRNRPNIEVPAVEKKWEAEIEGQAIRKAAYSITVCDSIAQHLHRTYGVPKPIVVRNTPPRSPAPVPSEKSLRKVYGFSDLDFVAVYVGKIAANRGVTDILQALPHAFSRVKFVTLGPFDPKFQKVFDEMVDKLGLRSRVFCHPPVRQEEISGMIADCDLSLTTMNRVCLSYVYTLPNKLFESIQAGLPIIGPDSPEIVKILDTYDCGTTYRDGDHFHLAFKINSLVEDPARRRAYRENTRLAARELCWEEEKKRLVEAHESYFADRDSLKDPKLATKAS